MKNPALFLLSLLAFNTLLAQQDIKLPGVVVEQNSKYRTGNIHYLSNAEIKSAGAAPQRSDGEGKFTLLFADRPGGDVVRIYAAKSGYEVVNEAEFKQASVIGRLQPLKIVMCPSGQLYDNQIAYYNIAKDASFDAYKRQIATLQKAGREKERLMAELRVQFHQDVKTKEEAIALLDQQRQFTERQAKDLADKWVTVNLDDESPAYQRAFAAFEAKNIQLAIAILDSLDLEKRLALNSNEKAREEVLRDTLQKNIARREEEIRQDVNMCLFKARLYKLDFEWEKAEQLYDLAMKYDEGNIDVTFEVAYFMQLQNQFIKARQYYEKALTQNPPPFTKSAILNNLGDLLSYNDDWSGTKQAYDEALQIRRKLAVENPDVYLPDVALSLNSLGILFMDNNDRSGAKKYYEEALQIYRKLAGEDPDVYLPDVAGMLTNLGILLTDNKDISGAKKNYDEALQIYKKFAGENPDDYLPNMAITLNNLGLLLSADNDKSGAKQAFDEALQIYRKFAGKNPDAYLPDMANTLNDLGSLLADMNDGSEAKKALDEALQIRRKLAEENSDVYLPYAATTLANLGVLLMDNNDMIGAKKALDEALQIYRKFLGRNPDVYLPFVANTLNNLGSWLSANGDMNGAKQAYEEVLQIYRELAGKNPDVYLPYMANALNNLGNLLSDNKDRSGAKQAYDESLQIYRKLAAKNPDVYLPDVAGALNILGDLLWADGDMKNAKESYEEALQVRRELAGKNPDVYLPDVAGALISLGNLLSENDDDMNEAKQTYEEALQMYRNLAGQKNDVYLQQNIAITLSNLGNLLSYYKDMNGAKPAYEEALQIYRKLAGENPQTYNLDVAATDINMGLVYEHLLKTTGTMSLKKEGVDLMQDAEQRLATFPEENSRVRQYRPAVQRLTKFFEAFDEASFLLVRQLSRLDTLKAQTKAEKDPHQKVLLQEKVLKFLFDLEKTAPGNDQVKNLISSGYGSLAWYQLFDKQFAAAEQSARTGLEKDPAKEWINTNLAPALLYQGKWEEAKQVYLKLKDKKYGKGTYNDAFLKDLDVMEKENIIHPDVKKARQLLLNK